MREKEITRNNNRTLSIAYLKTPQNIIVKVRWKVIVSVKILMKPTKNKNPGSS